MVNINGLTTETVNENTKNIDSLDALSIVQPTNEKLEVRSIRMISQITGVGAEEAEKVLRQTDMKVANAIVMIMAGCDKAKAAEVLEKTGGRVREAIEYAE